MKVKIKEETIKEIADVVKWYNKTKEHDTDFNILFKDISIRIFDEILEDENIKKFLVAEEL